VNFQQTVVALTVTVAVPLPVAVVCRYFPVRLATSTTLLRAGSESASTEALTTNATPIAEHSARTTREGTSTSLLLPQRGLPVL